MHLLTPRSGLIEMITSVDGVEPRKKKRAHPLA